MDCRTTWFNYYIIYKFDKMEQKKALEILKAALDLAVSKGTFGRLEDIQAIILAFNVIAKDYETNNGAD